MQNQELEVKVSIVMPVLNTIRYVRECMDSLIHQTLKEIEILCVDANSTDGTREILQEYADRDSRVHIYTDSKGSTGYANNLGMRYARGEYLAIVEPDDFVALDMYENLYKAAIENDADVVRADYKVFFGETDEREYIDKAIASSDDYGKIHCPGKEQRLFKNDMSTWAGIYRLSFLHENHICHNETPGAAYQDNGFWFLVMAHAEKIYYMPVSGYRYRMDNPNSSIHNRKKLFAICDEYEFVAKRMRQEGIYDRFEEVYLWAKFIRYLSAYYRLDTSLKPEFADRFAREMQENFQNMKSDKNIFSKGQQKLLCLLLESGEAFHGCIEQQRAIFCKLVDSKQTLIQYGCGSDGFRLLNEIRRIGKLDRIECLCDSNPRLWRTEIFDKTVISFDEIKDKYPEARYLIASINYGDEIKEYLIGRGIKRNRVFIMSFC